MERLAEYFSMSGDTLPGPDQALDLSQPVERVPLDGSFTVTLEAAQSFVQNGEGRIQLPPVRLPETLAPAHELRALTRIVTAGDNVLEDYGSGLTFPEPLLDAPRLVPGAELDLWYETRGVPGLRLAMT